MAPYSPLPPPNIPKLHHLESRPFPHIFGQTLPTSTSKSTQPQPQTKFISQRGRYLGSLALCSLIFLLVLIVSPGTASRGLSQVEAYRAAVHVDMKINAGPRGWLSQVGEISGEELGSDLGLGKRQAVGIGSPAMPQVGPVAPSPLPFPNGNSGQSGTSPPETQSSRATPGVYPSPGQAEDASAEYRPSEAGGMEAGNARATSALTVLPGRRDGVVRGDRKGKRRWVWADDDNE